MKTTGKQNKWLTAGITKFHDSALIVETSLPFSVAPVLPRA